MYKLDSQKFADLLFEHVYSGTDPIPERIKELDVYFSSVEKLVDVDFSYISFEDIELIERYQKVVSGHNQRINSMLQCISGLPKVKAPCSFF